jgi:hypothetical protein
MTFEEEETIARKRLQVILAAICATILTLSAAVYWQADLMVIWWSLSVGPQIIYLFYPAGLWSRVVAAVVYALVVTPCLLVFAFLLYVSIFHPNLC